MDLQSQNPYPLGFDVVGESSPTKGTVFGFYWERDSPRIDEINDYEFLKNNSKIFYAKNHNLGSFSEEENTVDQNSTVLINSIGKKSLKT